MATPTTDKTGQIVPRTAQQNGEGGLVSLLQKMGPEIQRALPKHISPDRMARIAITALRTGRDLMLCTAPSFAGCVMVAAQLGLEVNTPLGHAYLIARKSKYLPPDQRECTLIVGYQGYIELARRSGLVSTVYAYAVRDGDDFGYKLGLEPDVHHVPSEDAGREERAITHVYAVAKMKDSEERVFVVLTRAQVEARRRRSTASGSGPWVTDYEAMCLKTAVRALWKWLPKSTEVQKADAVDAVSEGTAALASSFDPMVTDALQKHGLELPPDAEPEAQPQPEVKAEVVS